jgi:hypothetical protein
MYYYSYAIMCFFQREDAKPRAFLEKKNKNTRRIINALTFIHIAFASKDLSYIYMILHLCCILFYFILFYLLVMMIDINVTSPINNTQL